MSIKKLAMEVPVTHEGIFILRDLLGLSTSELPISPQAVMKLDHLTKHPAIKDVLFLAIGFESQAFHTCERKNFQIGFSILDTRDFESLCPSQFGPTELLTSAVQIRRRICALTAGRDVFLIYHGGSNHLKLLDQLNISVKTFYTLDTLKVISNPWQLAPKPSLEWLLDEFDVPFQKENLRVAGNDANFLLRALLMIVIRDAETRVGLEERQDDLLVVLRGLAQLKVPENGAKHFKLK